MITMIGALSLNNCVGIKNSLPWSIPSDLKFFKQQTLGHNIVMGWNTYISLGKKPLPGRTNIVLIDDRSKFDSELSDVSGFTFIRLEDLVTEMKENDSKRYYIIGGPKTWEMFANIYDNAVITRVNTKIDGDAYVNPSVMRNLILTSSVKPDPTFISENDEFEYQFEFYRVRNT